MLNLMKMITSYSITNGLQRVGYGLTALQLRTDLDTRYKLNKLRVMAAIDKAIELLEKVLEENCKLSEGYEIKPETRDEIESWLKWYNDLQKRADGISPNEDSGLTIPVVINCANCDHAKSDNFQIHCDGCISYSNHSKRCL